MFNDMRFNKMRKSYCLQSYLRAAICRNILFLIVGHDNGHFDLVSLMGVSVLNK
jgi:hypothetical protein